MAPKPHTGKSSSIWLAKNGVSEPRAELVTEFEYLMGTISSYLMRRILNTPESNARAKKMIKDLRPMDQLSWIWQRQENSGGNPADFLVTIIRAFCSTCL